MILWRSYCVGDDEALRLVQRRQCARTGESVPLPDLNDPLLVMAKVACRDGRPVGAVLARATVELMYIGDDARVLRSALSFREEFRRELRQRGAAEVCISAFQATLSKIVPLLRRAGFRRSNDDYVVFVREL